MTFVVRMVAAITLHIARQVSFVAVTAHPAATGWFVLWIPAGLMVVAITIRSARQGWFAAGMVHHATMETRARAIRACRAAALTRPFVRRPRPAAPTELRARTACNAPWTRADRTAVAIEPRGARQVKFVVLTGRPVTTVTHARSIFAEQVAVANIRRFVRPTSYAVRMERRAMMG